jgi:hypothetical protein
MTFSNSYNTNIFYDGVEHLQKKVHPLRDSNPQSSDWKSDALSIRPRGQILLHGIPPSFDLPPFHFHMCCATEPETVINSRPRAGMHNERTIHQCMHCVCRTIIHTQLFFTTCHPNTKSAFLNSRVTILLGHRTSLLLTETQKRSQGGSNSRP